HTLGRDILDELEMMARGDLGRLRDAERGDAQFGVRKPDDGLDEGAGPGIAAQQLEAQQVAVERDRPVEVGHGPRRVPDAADHAVAPATGAVVRSGRAITSRTARAMPVRSGSS